VAVAQPVYFSCGLRATEFVFSYQLLHYYSLFKILHGRKREKEKLTMNVLRLMKNAA
jgi:hypothetical protein